MSSLYDMYQGEDDKHVCAKCIHDKYLRKMIRSNLDSNECTYCKRKSKNLIATALCNLVELIFKGIQSEWEHPVDVLGYDSAEGGWLGTVYDTYDLSEYIEKEVQITNPDLLEDIVDFLGDDQWCKRPGDSDFSDELNLSWNYFCELIKYDYRYTFFQIDEKIYLDPDSWGNDAPISPKCFLNTLNSIVKNNKKIIKKFQKGTRLFRVRLFPQKQLRYTVKELGTPPKEYSRTNRMSPAGIPLFYGAFDKDTALQEIYTRRNSDDQYAIIAEFETTTDLEILNLCDIHDTTSLFDLKNQKRRKVMKFLRKFSLEISKEIILDGREHIDYVPTQILTEHFRHIFKRKGKNSLNGILYKSSRISNGINCALFVENKQCIEATDPNNYPSILRLINQTEIKI